MREELIQAGWVGALQAAASHDSSRGRLADFAIRRIYGAMQDHLRSCDWLSRPVRRRVREGADIAPRNVGIDESVKDPSSLYAIARLIDRIDVELLLSKAYLSANERAVIEERFFKGTKFEVIAEKMGMSKPNVILIRRQALARLAGMARCAG